jgi:hypothetical protein
VTDSTETRTCRCGYTGPASEFRKKLRDGRFRDLTTCPKCRKYHREIQRRDASNARRRAKRAAAKASPESYAAYRDEMLRAKYELSEDEYQRMFEEQGGQCWYCGAASTEKRLVVDHCHKTGVVRRLLCNSCNLGQGQMKDDWRILLKAAETLMGFEAVPLRILVQHANPALDVPAAPEIDGTTAGTGAQNDNGDLAQNRDQVPVLVTDFA